MPARVLLVAHDQAVQQTATAVARHEGWDVLTAADATDGLRRWQADQPDLVVVDALLEPVDGFRFVEQLRMAETAPAHTSVALIGPDADLESKIRAFRSGADDYVGRPLNAVVLAARARGLLEQGRPAQKAEFHPAKGRVMAWYGAKGGVGTTTLAINTAIALHRESKRSVALVDAVLQLGDHRVFLDLRPDARSIADACTGPTVDQDLLQKCLVRHDSGVDLLLAPMHPEAAEQVSAEYHHLQQVVDLLRTTHDLVLVDIDKRLDDHTLDVVSGADTVMMVLTADLACLKNMRVLLATFEQIGLAAERVQLVLNRSNAQTGISVEAAERVLPHRIDHLVPNDYRTAIGSLNSGTPFMVNRADSNIGRAVTKLARDATSPRTPAEPAPRIGKLAPALQTGR